MYPLVACCMAIKLVNYVTLLLSYYSRWKFLTIDANMVECLFTSAFGLFPSDLLVLICANEKWMGNSKMQMRYSIHFSFAYECRQVRRRQFECRRGQMTFNHICVYYCQEFQSCLSVIYYIKYICIPSRVTMSCIWNWK